ncbi:MAG TPA: sugar transferase [Anaerolineales bacterium]|nr:sugar transferase [Anaerolineales bacterium]
MAEPLRPGFRLRPNEHRLVLLISDLAASTLAAFLAVYVWKQYWLQLWVAKGVDIERAERIFKIQGIHVPLWFYLLPLGWLLLMVELYDAHTAVSVQKTLRGISRAAFIGIVVYALVFIFNQDPSSLPRIAVGAFIILASVFTVVTRLSYIRLYTTSGLQRRVLIVGAGKAGMTLAKVYCDASPPPFSLIGFIDDDFQKIDKMYAGYPVIGASKDLLAIVDQYRVSDLVVAITGDMQGSTFQTILDVQERGVEVSRMPILYEEITQRVPVHHLESDWLIRSFVDQLKVSVFYDLVKRLLDFVGGLLGLIVFAISFPFIALATAVDSGLPILYSQDRLGRGGQAFKIYKYRTMYQNAEADGMPQQAAENDERVTRVGSFLRVTHLDELPQFWNVLRGDMSLVGPRAERDQLIAEYQKQIPFYRARLLVKPGLTGWAQINYGYVATVTETAIKLEYDLYYIKHRSLMLDVTIVLRTIGTVLSRKGR